MRIVSLLPSATELLALIGAGDHLVGRSHECDHAPGVDIEALPVLTAQRTRYDPLSGANAAEIDRQVRDQLESGASLYTLDTERLIDLRPDLIVTQDLCRVCSIDLDTVRAAAATLHERLGAEPEVVSLNPASIEDVLDDALRLGAETGLEGPAREAVVRLRERLYRAQEFVNPYTEGPSVAFFEWTDPLFVGGHWTPQIIERAGARHPLNPTVPAPATGTASGMQQGERRAGKSVAIPPEVLVATRPDAVIVCPCGLTLEQTADATRRDLENRPWWGELPAVRAGRVALVDGNQMFNRPGPRLVEAFEWAVGWLNDRPELIPDGFPWRAWTPASASDARSLPDEPVTPG